MCQPYIESTTVCSDIMYMFIYNMFVDPKIVESNFSDRFTFSNIRGRTSCRIYRLALPLLLSSLSKLRIFLLPYCYLFKRVPIVANFSEFGKIANNSIR